MKELVTAMNNVMLNVRSIAKNTTVGNENYGYKGVSDMDVKHAIQKEMALNNLVIVPIKIQPTTKLVNWFETDKYNKQKAKQNVFLEVLVDYKLIHESGQYLDLQGYGHAIDSGDKAAGKATTYALKYTLLYAFMIATGDIQDTDNSHSKNLNMPPVTIPRQFTEKENEAIKSFISDAFIGIVNLKEVQAKYKELMTAFPQHQTFLKELYTNELSVEIKSAYEKELEANPDQETELKTKYGI